MELAPRTSYREDSQPLLENRHVWRGRQQGAAKGRDIRTPLDIYTAGSDRTPTATSHQPLPQLRQSETAAAPRHLHGATTWLVQTEVKGRLWTDRRWWRRGEEADNTMLKVEHTSTQKQHHNQPTLRVSPRQEAILHGLP